MDGVFGGLEATGLALSGSITSVDGSLPNFWSVVNWSRNKW